MSAREAGHCKVHIRRFIQLDLSRVRCGTAGTCGERTIHTSALLRKKLRVKIPSFSSNDSRRTGPGMADLQPSSNHVSYGGRFSVDLTEDASVECWRKKSDDSNSADDTSNAKPCVVPADFRVWETVGRRSDGNDESTFRFKVMSYNVLAQYLLECHPYLYTGCDARNLKWKCRAARLFDEIIGHSPDILCLQEVQASHMKSFYSKFEEYGYFGIYKQKTGHRQDGCAIYFKSSLFKLEDHVSVEFYQPELPILNRDNIGIIVKLAPCSFPDSPIVVATTHLLYNPKRTDVRLAQIQVFLAEIDRFAYSQGKDSGHYPIILTGDLNSKPESAVIKLLDRGYVRASPFRDSSDWQRIGVTDNCQHLSVYLNRQVGLNTDYKNIKIYNSEYSASLTNTDGVGNERYSRQDFSEMFNSDVIEHFLHLNSVYGKYKSDGSEEASTFQDYWVTVDYMYFSCNNTLSLEERLRLPTVTECGALGCLPNEVYGSDHLSLAAVFELKPHDSALSNTQSTNHV